MRRRDSMWWYVIDCRDLGMNYDRTWFIITKVLDVIRYTRTVKFLVEGFFISGFDVLGKGQYELYAVFNRSSDTLYPEQFLLSQAVKGLAKLKLVSCEKGVIK